MSTKPRLTGVALAAVMTCLLAGCKSGASASAGATTSAGGSPTAAAGTTSAAVAAGQSAVTGSGGGGASSGSAAASPAAGGGSGIADPCTLVTVAELSQAVGVQYTAISGSGGSCSVTGPGPASFEYTVQQESPTNTWAAQVATIQGDDGQALNEPGIGDKAVWGGKEFAAEADGYIVGVIGADFPSTPQGSGFTRTSAIAKLLISKLG